MATRYAVLRQMGRVMIDGKGRSGRVVGQGANPPRKYFVVAAWAADELGANGWQ